MTREEMDKLRTEDFEWFVEHYDELYAKYGECHIAIKGKKVLGVYQSAAEGIEATGQTEEPGSFIVQYCNGDESAYTITMMSFRII